MVCSTVLLRYATHYILVTCFFQLLGIFHLLLKQYGRFRKSMAFHYLVPFFFFGFFFHCEMLGIKSKCTILVLFLPLAALKESSVRCFLRDRDRKGQLGSEAPEQCGSADSRLLMAPVFQFTAATANSTHSALCLGFFFFLYTPPLPPPTPTRLIRKSDAARDVICHTVCVSEECVL